MAPGDAARRYHRLSSLSYTPPPYPTPPADHPLVVQDFVGYDLDRLPPPWKVYPPDLPQVELPVVWPPVAGSAMEALAGRATPGAGVVDLAALARLLHLSAGVVRYRDSALTGRRWWFRAAGSAGGRAPLEVYVSARGVRDVPDGVYWYHPLDHVLVQIGPAGAGDATTLVVTGVPWRTSWKYAERGLRHVFWDAGSMLAQTLALADSAGLGPRLWTRFPDAEVGALVGADAVDEFAVAVVALGAGEPAIRPMGEATAGTIGEAPKEFPLITITQRAGDLAALGEPWAVAPAVGGPLPGSADLDTVILQRGSARRMDAAATVSAELLRSSLAVALRGIGVPHHVVVHGVEGVAPGLYRWPDLERPLRAGRLRDELLRLSWDMDLARDAAFVAIGTVDLATLDDRGYREAQLQAGIVSGRLHLAAYALGVGASGLSFLDEEIEPLLGEPLAGLLLTCVGVPTYATKPGGMPRAPVSIVTPTPGDTPR